MTSTAKPFPMKAKVVLHGLKAADFNDKIGVIQGPVNNEGRQSVYVEDLDKTVALKIANLKYQPRPLDSLSNKELKNILRFKQAALKFQGMDKSDLQEKLQELTTDQLEIAEWLAMANAGGSSTTNTNTNTPSTSNGNTTSSSPLDQFDNMNPEMLRQQAQMMRSMPPAAIRSMNPQLAHMTDAQIQQAAAQMEMMASNPAMMQQAKQQMKNMTPAQKAQYEKMMAGQPAPAATATTNQSPQERLANMSPEQLRQQAQMMRSMPPDTLRSLNPQMAKMTDAQIEQAASQMEMMASNPELMKMANDQMKNLTPQQMEQMMMQGSASAGDNPNTLNPMAMGMGSQQQQQPNNMTMDPAKMLETMTPKQIKDMMTMLKSNPDMLNQMAAQSGMPKEGLEKTLSMFADMSEEQLETSLKTLAKVQKATAGIQNVWKKGDALVGGKLKLVVIVGTILCVVLIVLYLLGGESPAEATTKIIQDNIPLSTPSTTQEDAVPEMEDEFGEL